MTNMAFTLSSPGGGKKVEIGARVLTVIAGPCAIESRDHSVRMAKELAAICEELQVGFIFKSSFDKDCRSSSDSFHGIGLEAALEIYAEIRADLDVPVTTDFAQAEWAEALAHQIDLIQVPAYLCRQTHILRAAAETKLPIHLKKGQFMSPWNLKNSVDKIRVSGSSEGIIITDRGSFFGYEDLVNDMRFQRVATDLGVAGFDGTHSVQRPTSEGKVSGGRREFIASLTRAAVAAGADVLFLEVHDNPSQAKSDPATVLDLKHFRNIVLQAKHMFEARKALSEFCNIEPILEGE